MAPATAISPPNSTTTAIAHLRFGRGGHGRTPGPGARFAASYRIGNGAAGNAGTDAIAYLVLRNATLSGATVTPRNPLPAIGGSVARNRRRR